MDFVLYVLDKLKLIINRKKLVLELVKKLTHLGLVIDSKNMVFRISKDKAKDMKYLLSLLERTCKK